MVDSQTAEDNIKTFLRPGEVLLWYGVPSVRRFLAGIVAQTLFGLIPILFSLAFFGLCISSALHRGFRLADLPLLLAILIFAAFFGGVGIYCLLAPLMVPRRLRKVVYAVTDQRGLVLTTTHSTWNPVPARTSGVPLIEFTLEQLQRGERKWWDFGRTDLVFDREWRRRNKGGGYWHYFGFLGLEDLVPAELAIRSHKNSCNANL